ncbi:MAG: hypothetical protein ACKVOK_16215 [Flavobacteriales bacterium]
MKSLFLIPVLFLFSLAIHSQSDYTLTITYNGKAVCNYDVTLKQGGVEVGKGTTSSEGDVVFSQIILLAPNVDVHAKKVGGGADMHFEVSGYVVFGEDNTYELKMEEILKEITEGSGMPESMFADSWGLNQLNCQ